MKADQFSTEMDVKLTDRESLWGVLMLEKAGVFHTH